MPPKTRYAKSDGVRIAYQVAGDGSFDLVLVPGFVSNVEFCWQNPLMARVNKRLASYSRLIIFDKRGTGRSDPVSEAPSMEQRLKDLLAVMDAAGSRKAALIGISEGGPASILFAATYPERTTQLLLYGTAARFSHAPDYEWGFETGPYAASLDKMEERWGEAATIGLFAPSYKNDENARETWGNLERAGASPGMARSVMEALIEIDVRPALHRIRVPTTIIHRRGDRAVLFGNARYLAEHIPGAKLVELSGVDHFPFLPESDDIWDEVAETLTGTRHCGASERVLATVLFTDIVGSTQKAHDLGDRKWRDLLEQYYAAVRAELRRFGGRELDTAGDGFFARFDTPAHAIDCAKAINQSVRSLGIDARTGIHAGECEVTGEKLSGMAVHIGARVMGLAGPGEILVSSTVKEIVTGSKLAFTDRGAHALKGVPDEWRVYSVGDVGLDAVK